MGEIADDEFFQMVDDEESEGVVCNRCGEEELHWRDVGDEVWRLFDVLDQPHICGAADGFERIE